MTNNSVVALFKAKNRTMFAKKKKKSDDSG